MLLHSIATSSDLWSPQLPVWSTSFRILTIDRPGHGGDVARAQCFAESREAVNPERMRNADGEETPLPATFNV